MSPAASERGVVVTGIGCVSPLGVGLDATWAAALAGESGVVAIDRFDTEGYACRIAGQVPEELDLSDLPGKEARRLDRGIALALVAAREALESAKLSAADVDPARVGIAVGSGIGGIASLEREIDSLVSNGPRRVSPFTIPMAICNMPGGYLAIRHGFTGPNLCHVSACASGSHSIGEAARSIARGDADAMLAGGCEAPITRIATAGFGAMRALSTRNDEPDRASRPFDRERDGFVMSEGSAVLVLEAESHARARGATVLAQFLGYGATADATHIAQPTEDGLGPQRCMRLALEDAGLAPSDVDYLNPHATSTPAGDASEARAIRAVFGSHTDSLPISATKSMTGHLLGAAGAAEAALGIRSLETGQIPATRNLDDLDPDCALDHVIGSPRATSVRTFLSNSFGFGGTNATLIFGRA